MPIVQGKSKMDKAVTEEKVKKEKPWVSYTADQYHKAISEMVHHSVKITHSAIPPGGVRVGIDKGIKLPYVSVRTLFGHGLPVLTDSVNKGPASINIHMQINLVDRDASSLAPAQDVALIKSLLSEFSKKTYVNCRSISPRLRQILLPTDSGYLAITPLSAAGIGLLLGDSLSRLTARVNIQNKDKSAAVKPLIKIKRTDILLGGSKPFNVGNLAYKMVYPMVGSFPTADNEIRHALSLHYKGIPLQDLQKFPYSLVSQYVSWRNKLDGHTDSNSESRSEHEKYLARFTRYWLGLGSDAYEMLTENRNELPNRNKLFSENISSFDQGLIDSKLRDSAWRSQFASRLAKTIAHIEKDDKRRYEYSQNDINTITKIVKGILI